MRVLPFTFLALLLVAGCSDDGGGSALPDQGVDQTVTDLAGKDLALPDQLAPDQLAPDLLAPDLTSPPTCTDKLQNGDESDVDCGGATCPACAHLKKCNKSGDCLSGVCDKGICQKPSCSDKVQNGDESDVDCGGATCPGCADTKNCNKPAD